MLKIIHRDKLQRVIQIGDMVMWAASRQGYGMNFGRVTNLTEKQVWMQPLEGGKKRRFYPDHCLVVTAQVEKNIEDGVGAHLEEPVLGTRESFVDRHPIAGQTAESWFAARGISVEEHLAEMSGRTIEEGTSE